jgi:hypothetical protein
MWSFYSLARSLGQFGVILTSICHLGKSIGTSSLFDIGPEGPELKGQ